MAAVHDALPLRQCRRPAAGRADGLRLRAGRDGPVRRAVRGQDEPGGLRSACGGRCGGGPRRPAAGDRAAAAQGGAGWPRQAVRAGGDGTGPAGHLRPGLRAGAADLRADRVGTWWRPGRTGRAVGDGGGPARAAGRRRGRRCAARPSSRTSRHWWRRPRRCCPGSGPLPCATAAETERILRWLEEPGTRLVELTGGTWTCPARGAGGLGDLLEHRPAPHRPDRGPPPPPPHPPARPAEPPVDDRSRKPSGPDLRCRSADPGGWRG